ncbi:MAG: TrkA C-terminal domain-containing protein [Planctomycetes bacterium]|nr:TrkA C-terminal domain-containing protein [Planctomycetota bacterium]MCB9905185.1 TrkA C-terminal domain-containing protein [Planctomycetota bacterium]
MITTFSLLLIILLSVSCVRAGSMALSFTGLSKEVARFQALSSFLGVGFTTSESEKVTSHPVRRRIISTLMMLGYFGLGSGLVSVISVVTQSTTEQLGQELIVVVAGVVTIVALFGWKVFDPLIERGVMKALGKRYGSLVHDYAELLRVDKGYSISNVQVIAGGWMDGRSLRELRLTDEGVLVLNVTRASGVTLATPGPDTVLSEGDQLLSYGLEEDLLALAKRKGGHEGDATHELCVGLHHGRSSIEESQDIQARFTAEGGEG